MRYGDALNGISYNPKIAVVDGTVGKVWVNASTFSAYDTRSSDGAREGNRNKTGFRSAPRWVTE